MTDSRAVLARIDRYLIRKGMAASTFGRLAVNDGKLVGRLRGGGSLRLETAQKVLAFMRPARRQAKARLRASSATQARS